MRRKNRAKRVAPKSKKRVVIVCAAVLAVLAAALAAFLIVRDGASNVADYKKKAALLRAAALTEETRELTGASPAGGRAGQAVFISLCNTEERATVLCGTGADLETAWENADGKARAFLKGSNYNPVWVKADVVYTSDVLDAEELSKAVLKARHEFYRYGIAFDTDYKTALLEAELNGAKIYDYDNGGIDFEYLNRYLSKSGREKLEELPDAYTLFQCLGWFCDEDGEVYELYSDGLAYGRREIELIDADYAAGLIESAAGFLEEQINEDGSFVYGIYPRFDNEIENYNIVRHASTIWSLICDYRMEPDETLASEIRRTIGYMLTQVVYDRAGRAYLYEEKNDEIKLGGCGMAVIALTEYMDAFETDEYEEVCRALGDGILSMMDTEAGTYYHVLNGNFTQKEEYRTVYYDGEATFALCRLYGLTGDAVWLDAARSAVDHFIAADYTQYKDHWVAYSMNEITKYVTNEPDYYAFALANAQVNLEAIRDRDATSHTYLELLMATFEVYDRMVENGVSTAGFDLPMFLKTIYTRVDRQLNGYFYPEYAMYMKNPQRILGTFMVRNDGYRVRIDDVQHNIGGYYMYWKNYEKLVEYGLLDCK